MRYSAAQEPAAIKLSTYGVRRPARHRELAVNEITSRKDGLFLWDAISADTERRILADPDRPTGGRRHADTDTPAFRQVTIRWPVGAVTVRCRSPTFRRQARVDSGRIGDSRTGRDRSRVRHGLASSYICTPVTDQPVDDLIFLRTKHASRVNPTASYLCRHMIGGRAELRTTSGLRPRAPLRSRE